MDHFVVIYCLLALFLPSTSADEDVKFATSCEVCKIVSNELEARLKETGKSHSVIETGYSIEGKKNKMKYRSSELRLVESLDGLCERMLDYNIHKERTDSSRFAKGMSQTFKTLHGLVNKGVKVDLGIPYELWDKPAAEITNLKTQCEKLLEDYEEEIEEWYASHHDTYNLQNYLCRMKMLKKSEQSCLNEDSKTPSKGEKEL